MGCTPSIQVSQTGVVYCRKEDLSNSPHQTSTELAAASDASPTCTTVSLPPLKRVPPLPLSFTEGKTNSSEAETQTAPYSMKGSVNNVCLGPIKLKQHIMSILLVFGKEDSQSDGFWWAAEKGGYQCNLARTAESAVESYLDKHHDVIIIDARHNNIFDAEGLCRSIRATKSNEHTVIVAVTKYHRDKEEPCILPLLNAGFNKRFIENPSVTVCLNELLSLEHGEVRNQVKLRAANALLVVLEHSSDPVELTNEHYQIQYVNPAYERLTGYTCDELTGKDSRELPKTDKSNKVDSSDPMNAHIKKGKSWEGVTRGRRKGGDSFSLHCHSIPVFGQSGKIRHIVAIKNPTLESSSSLDIYGADYHSAGHYRGRKESLARIHIEAPITKVINIINAAQENSPNTVVQALDKVLEILRSSELYSPYAQQVKDGDQMTSDLVGGLMTTGNVNKRYSSASEMSFGKSLTPILPSSPSTISTLSQVPPEVKNLLDTEPRWDFDIFKLERLTQKRPLVYLGLKTFQRFGVMDFLRISEKELVNWLHLIEANYHATNSYHNSTHAADVMHASAYFLGCEKVKMLFDQMDEVASLIAAVVHDLDHPGRTNSFLVNASSNLAILYNDLAVLESHHVSLAFQLSNRDDRVNIFKNMEREDYRALRGMVIDMVLATEMTKHFEHLNKFVSVINQQLSNPRDDMSDTGRNSPDSSSSRLANPDNRILIKRMLIKCADVSNPARPLSMCKEWALRIADEYCKQTDDEKVKSLPVVMPVFDRKKCNVPKSQLSFVDFFINDMFNNWDAFSEVPELMEHLTINYNYWKEQEPVAAREIEERISSDENSVG